MTSFAPAYAAFSANDPVWVKRSSTLASFAELLHSQSVVLLVEENPVFWPSLDIDEIVDTILDNFNAGVKRLGEILSHAPCPPAHALLHRFAQTRRGS